MAKATSRSNVTRTQSGLYCIHSHISAASFKNANNRKNAVILVSSPHDSFSDLSLSSFYQWRLQCTQYSLSDYPRHILLTTLLIIVTLYCHIKHALHVKLECSLALTHIWPIYTIKWNMAIKYVIYSVHNILIKMIKKLLF